MSENNIFESLYKIDVKKHIEKKGNFNYLSWPYAVSELRKAAPDATWETIKFDGKPYCETKAGCFVEVAVTVNGITLSQIHPVLDMRNKTILAPNAFEINTSIQRCLVKAIALHGLGLYIYAGEDLPEVDAVTPPLKSVSIGDFSEEEQAFLKETAIDIMGKVKDNNIAGAYELLVKLDGDETLVMRGLVDATTRAKINEYRKTLNNKGMKDKTPQAMVISNPDTTKDNIPSFDDKSGLGTSMRIAN